MSDKELEERLSQLEERLQRLDKDQDRQTAYWAIIESVLPMDARRHLRAAGREQLLAARSILDMWIERIDRAPADRAAAGVRESIPVD